MTEPSEKSIGASLRDRRLELGISFEEIVARTRIRQSYLEALEREEFESFPGDAYLKGYLKGYAECLGLDAQQLLAALPKKAPTSPHSNLVETASLSSLGGGSPRSPLLSRGGLLLTVLLILLVLGWLLFGRQSIVSQPEVVNQPAVVKPRENPLPAAVEQPVNPAANTETTATEPTIPAAETAAATATDGTISTPVQGAESTGAAPPVAEPSATLSDPARSDAGVLRLQASGPGEMELTIDGRPAQRYSLQANTILSWKVGRTVRIYLENPGSARLWLGGREVDLGGRNQIVLQSTEESGR